MKKSKVRVAANLILWIGIIACFLGCIVYLADYEWDIFDKMGLDFSVADDAALWMTADFIILGGFILIFIILCIIATCRERAMARKAAEEEKILTVVEEPEAPVEEIVEEIPVEEAEPVEEPAEEPVVEDTPAEEPVKEAGKVETTCRSLIKKANLPDDTYDKAVKVGKVVLPVAAGCLVTALISKSINNARREKARKNFYQWLG